MLHTINKSPFTVNTFETCLRFLQSGDPVLFLEDGVYSVQSSHRFSGRIAELQASNPVYVLQPDLEARGITNTVDGVNLIDYGGFVDLVEEHTVNSWL